MTAERLKMEAAAKKYDGGIEETAAIVCQKLHSRDSQSKAVLKS
jgi:hypothetical protein